MSRTDIRDRRGIVIEAKCLLKRFRTGNPAEKQRSLNLLRFHPYLAAMSREEILAHPERVQLKHALHGVAVNLGYESWNELRVLLDVPRTGRYFVEEGWSHIFSSGHEHGVRFVWDRKAERILAMDVERAGGWRALNSTGVRDVLESLNDNEVFESVEEAALGRIADFARPEQIVESLPDWAQDVVASGEALSPEVSEMVVRLSDLGYPVARGLSQDQALDAFEEIYCGELSHASRCAHRHSGPCTCIRGELAELLEEFGREV